MPLASHSHPTSLGSSYRPSKLLKLNRCCSFLPLDPLSKASASNLNVFFSDQSSDHVLRSPQVPRTNFFLRFKRQVCDGPLGIQRGGRANSPSSRSRKNSSENRARKDLRNEQKNERRSLSRTVFEGKTRMKSRGNRSVLQIFHHFP